MHRQRQCRDLTLRPRRCAAMEASEVALRGPRRPRRRRREVSEAATEASEVASRGPRRPRHDFLGAHGIPYVNDNSQSLLVFLP